MINSQNEFEVGLFFMPFGMRLKSRLKGLLPSQSANPAEAADHELFLQSAKSSHSPILQRMAFTITQGMISFLQSYTQVKLSL
jgi:hypothetical protein